MPPDVDHDAMVIVGTVVHGDKRGREMGFPTANIALAAGATFPPDGVYCCVVKLSQHDGLYGGTASVGNNPTFADIDGRRVEAFIHNLDEPLYGLTAELRLVHRLRDMRRFPSVKDLIAHAELDVLKSRQLLVELGLPGAN